MPKRLKKTKPSPLKMSFSANEHESDDLNIELDQSLIALRQLIATNPIPSIPQKKVMSPKPGSAPIWNDVVKRLTNAKIPQTATEYPVIELEQHKRKIEQGLNALETEINELRSLFERKYSVSTVTSVPQFEVSAASLIHNPVLRLWKRVLVIRPFIEKISDKEGKRLLFVAQENAKGMSGWSIVVDIIKKIRQFRYNACAKDIHRLRCALDWEDSEQIHFILSTIKPETNTEIQGLLQLTAKLEYLSAIMRNINIVNKISPYIWKLIFANLAKVAKSASQEDSVLIDDCVRAGYFTLNIKNAVGCDTFVNGHFLKGNPDIADCLLSKEVILTNIRHLSAAEAIDLAITLPEHRPQIIDAMERIFSTRVEATSIAPTYTPQRQNQATSSSSTERLDSTSTTLALLTEQLAAIKLK